LAREKQLKDRITQLQDYRRMGIKTLEEAAKYEDEKKRREAQKNREKNMYSRKAPPKKQPLDLSGQPGLEYLSQQERELCEHCHILPHPYLIAKEALIREYVKMGDLPAVRALQIVKLDTIKTMCIFEFMQTVGWINNKGHVAVTVSRIPQTSTPTATPNATTPTPIPVNVGNMTNGLDGEHQVSVSVQS